MIDRKTRAALTALSLLAFAATAPRAFAQAPATVNIAVDATAAGTPLKRVWPYHGYDEANYTTTPTGEALLRTLATLHTAPAHVRTHFLLNTGNGTASLKWGSTNAYAEDTAGNPIYNFTLLDGILDATTNAGTLPLVEIAFMPQALSVHPDPYQNTGIYTLDGGCFYPPKDYAKWGALIGTWASHVNARYPAVESSWLWELWNEPDIGYWHGTFAEYARLYDYTESALHRVLPNAVLGGPAVASVGAFLTQFLQHCDTGANALTGAAGTRLDMISFHAKGGVAIVAGRVQMNMGNQLRLHRDGFTAVAAIAKFKQTPIVVTEADPDGCAACPVSMTPADAYRNSPAYGAYEVAMMKRSLELEARLGVNLRGLLTWAFLFNNTPYFAGYRALSTNGIHLPVLNDFKLLGSLDGNRLPLTSSGARPLDDILTNSVRGQADVDAFATRNGQKIQILVWNYHDDLVAAAAAPVHLSVAMPAGFGTRAALTHLRVDDTHGDAYTVWVAQGSPAAPSPTQIAALQQAMEPAALEPARTVDVVTGSVALDFTLPRFGVSLITLTPVATTEPPDASIVDAAPDGPAQGGGSGVPDASVAGGTDGTGTSPGGAGGSAPTTPAAGSGNSNIGSGAAFGSGGAPGPAAANPKPSSGCACRMARSHSPFPFAEYAALGLALGLSAVRRTRREKSL